MEHGCWELSLTHLGMLMRKANLKLRRASLLKETTEVTKGTEMSIRKEDVRNDESGEVTIQYFLRWNPNSALLRIGANIAMYSFVHMLAG